jgi:ABC-type antimicrobial peptide transport system permease subunit
LLIVGDGMKLAAIGTAIGVAIAVVLSRVLGSLVFGVATTDAVAFAAVAIGALAVALLACYVPARRATKVDPLVALRRE